MDGKIIYLNMTGRPGSQGIAGLSNGELPPGARFPHLKDLIARAQAQYLGLIPATSVCFYTSCIKGGRKILRGHVHPTLDYHTFAPGGGVSNSRRCERELQETRACLCGLSRQLRDLVEYNSPSPGVRIICRK